MLKELEYKYIIDSIYKWEKELQIKLEIIKNGLNKEIELIKKIVYNFNNKIDNKTYQDNIYYLYKYINNNNNEFLSNFIHSKSFDEKGEYLFELIKILNYKDYKEKFYYLDFKNKYNIGNNLETKINIDKIMSFTSEDNTQKIDKDKFITINPKNDSICLYKYDNRSIFLIEELKIQIFHNYKFINKNSYLYFRNKKFFTLYSGSHIYFIDYNSDNNNIKLEQYILTDYSINFMIIIPNNNIITCSSSDCLKKWQILDNKYYVNIKKIYKNIDILDMLLVNNECFACYLRVIYKNEA